MSCHVTFRVMEAQFVILEDYAVMVDEPSFSIL